MLFLTRERVVTEALVDGFEDEALGPIPPCLHSWLNGDCRKDCVMGCGVGGAWQALEHERRIEWECRDAVTARPLRFSLIRMPPQTGSAETPADEPWALLDIRDIGQSSAADGEAARVQPRSEARLDETLAGWLWQTRETERRRIGSELHDGIGQHLSVLGWELKSALGKLEASDAEAAFALVKAAADQTDRVVEELRRMVKGLLPFAARDGVLSSVRQLCQQLDTAQPRTAISCRIELDEDEVPPPIRASVFRIVQEAAHNALRHANATSVEVEVRCRDGGVQVVVRDDGVGFRKEEVGDGTGLAIIRDRAAATGGSLRIATGAAGEGTSVEVSWRDASGE